MGLNDVGALSDAIVRLAGDRALRAAYGRRGRQRCLGMFDGERMVEQIEGVYSTLASGEAY